MVKELTDAGLLDYFDALVCGDMVSRSKPDPEIFMKACDMLKVAYDKAFAIEDSYNGIKSAYSAGLIPVMVPDMLAPTDEMRKLSRYIFKDLKDFRCFLLNC